MELVAFLGNDSESWGQVTGLINHETWEKIIIIKNSHDISFTLPEHAESLVIETNKPIIELKEEFKEKLKNKLSGFEVSLSIASGNGKEHMALISALLSIPIGLRFVVFTKKGVETIN